jgi:hypothetical protein
VLIWDLQRCLDFHDLNHLWVSRPGRLARIPEDLKVNKLDACDIQCEMELSIFSQYFPRRWSASQSSADLRVSVTHRQRLRGNLCCSDNFFRPVSPSDDFDKKRGHEPDRILCAATWRETRRLTKTVERQRKARREFTMITGRYQGWASLFGRRLGWPTYAQARKRMDPQGYGRLSRYSSRRYDMTIQVLFWGRLHFRFEPSGPFLLQYGTQFSLPH